MRYILLILLVFSQSAFPGTGRLSMPPGFLSSAAGPTTASLSGFDAAGARALTGELLLAGRSLAVPVSVAVNKSLASRVAVGLLRLTPAMRTAAALAWALKSGIEYCDDIGWCKPTEGLRYGPFSPFSGNCLSGMKFNSLSEIEASFSCLFVPALYSTSTWHARFNSVTCHLHGDTIADCNLTFTLRNAFTFEEISDTEHWTMYPFTRVHCNAPLSYNSSTNSCTDLSKIPADDVDFKRIEDSGVPFNYLQDLANGGYPIPLDLPKITTTLIPIGDPYTDLKTGTSMVPAVNIEPANSLADPFSVVYQTYNVPADPVTKLPIPNPTTGTVTDAVDPKSTEPQSDLCEKHPDIAACSDLKPPLEDPMLESIEKPFTFSEIAIGGSGACPAPRVFYVFDHSVEFSYQPICDFFVAMKPFVLAVSWIIAAMIIAGIRGGENNG